VKARLFLSISLVLSMFCASGQVFDRILRGGLLYDGLGNQPQKNDIGIRGDTIAAIGDLSAATTHDLIRVDNLAVAPGFINMLSWADGTLLKDGRSMSDIKQGVTLEVFGEGISAGPRKRSRRSSLWTTLGGYFDHLEKQGVSPNVASFVGATTIRTYVIGDENRAPTKVELSQMRRLVREAMEQGAMGVGSSLIYAPATFASTEELISLCAEAGMHGGIYITHMRSESDDILIAIRETLRISKEADLPAEIYHFKINHQRNWNKIDAVLALVDSAQRAGLRISANMYPYVASATGLKERIPAWAQDGGMKELRKRIQQPAVRKRILDDMANGVPTRNSDPTDVVIMGFKNDSFSTLYKGKRLDEVARLHGKSPDETVLDLVYAERTSIPALYFLIDEDNMMRMMRQPYVSIGSDAGSLSLTKEFTDLGVHPRAYGTFARVLGKFVRDEKLFTLEEAIRRMTSLPASHLKLTNRGVLKVGAKADVAVFDPHLVADRATFEEPHQYAVGMVHVFVNGQQVLRDGEHTGLLPGEIVRGPGWKKPVK